MYRSLTSILIIALFATITASCNDIVNSIQEPSPINLSFNFKNDSTYLYILDSRMLLMPQVNGKTLSIKQEMKLLCTYRVTGATNNQKNTTVTYTRITMSSGNGYNSNSFDSNDSTNLDSLYVPIASMINKPFNLIISDKGLASTQQLYETQPADSTDSADSIATVVTSFGDSSLRKMMTPCLNFYPPNPVKIGDSWKRNYTASSGFIHMKLENTYTLKGVEDGIAHIAMTANILPEFAGQNMAFRGIQNGTMDVDIESGLILNSKISQQLKGTILIGDKQQPVDASSEITIFGNKQQH